MASLLLIQHLLVTDTYELFLRGDGGGQAAIDEQAIVEVDDSFSSDSEETSSGCVMIRVGDEPILPYLSPKWNF